MTTINQVLKSIQDSSAELSLTELLNVHQGLARRTLQRWIQQLISEGKITAIGQGRARRYQIATKVTATTDNSEVFNIPLSEDSRDILNYIQQTLEARKPVGYQDDFLESYQPNQTFYLAENLRFQLHNMGSTQQEEYPAGTYSRSIFNRLLIDLSWASSNLEGNTYSLLDSRSCQ